MTTGMALALVALPTLAGLSLLGLADPKRRRTARDGKASPTWRPAGWLLLGASACGVAVAGAPALLIWFAEATAIGWALAHGFASVPARARTAAETLLSTRPSVLRPRAVLASMARTCVAERATAGRHAVILALVAIVATSALWVWRAVDRADRLTGSLVALAGVDLLSTRDPDRVAMRPCWRLLGTLDTGALRDLLSNRATTVRLADADGKEPGQDLQRCVLAQGGETTFLERLPGSAEARVTLDETVVATLHTVAERRLLADETLAELAQQSETARRLICRHADVTDLAGTRRFVGALRRDRAYAKSDDLLATIPLLDRPSDARPLCAP